MYTAYDEAPDDGSQVSVGVVVGTDGPGADVDPGDIGVGGGGPVDAPVPCKETHVEPEGESFVTHNKAEYVPTCEGAKVTATATE
jgi:hypothetical protein